MALIQLLGLADSDPVPGNYVQVAFAQGPASLGGAQYPAIILANKLSTGAGSHNVVYGPDTEVSLVSEQDVIDLAGAGSEAHRMWRRFNRVNKDTSLYMIFVEEAVGAQADGYIGFFDSDQMADSAGTVEVVIGDTRMGVGFASGDSPADIATAVANAINQRTELPVTAAVNGFGVDLTAKQVGTRGNFIRYHAKVTPSLGTGITVTPTARTLMANGSGDDDNSDALEVIKGQRFYYQISAAEDASQLQALGAQIDADAQPTEGIRNRYVAGAVGTLAATIAVSVGLNQARGELVWHQNSDWTPAELAANAGAVYSLMETALGSQSSLNFDGFGNDEITGTLWHLRAPLDGTRPSRAEIKSALLNGVTPIAANVTGSSYLVSRITTRSLQGSTNDYRVRDAHKVTVADAWTDDWQIQANLGFFGKVVGNDPVAGQLPPGAVVVTPERVRAVVLRILRAYEERSLLQNVDETIRDMRIIREPNVTGRISLSVPLQVISLLHQTAAFIAEVSQ